MHKHISTNTDTMHVKWQNHSLTGNIYNKLPNTEQTQGAHCVKLKNVSHRTHTYIYIFGEFQILEFDTWTWTPISADIGIFEVPLLTCVLIENHIKGVTITRLYKDALLWKGYS